MIDKDGANSNNNQMKNLFISFILKSFTNSFIASWILENVLISYAMHLFKY